MADLQNNFQDYFDYFTNIRYGNDMIANTVGSRAVISGSDSLGNIQKYANEYPEKLNLQDRFNFDTGNENAQTPIEKASESAGAAVTQTTSRIAEISKLYGVGILAIVLIAIGLYFFVSSTETGQAAIDSAKAAAGTAAKAAIA